MSSASKYKVLIVDDEKDIGELIADMLRSHFDCIYVESGELALESLAQHHSTVVCVVSDFKMSRMNGLEFRYKMLESYKDIPFIMVSGFISREDALAALEAKISSFLTKPFNTEQLLSVVTKFSNDRVGAITERIALEQIFIEEATNIVEDLEPLIMSLESKPNDVETLNTIFRLVHTIKGSSGVLESTHIRNYVHKYEDLLSKLKTGAMVATPEIVSILLKGFDVVEQMISALREGKAWTQNIEELVKIFDLSSLNKLAPSKVSQSQAADKETSKSEASKDSVNVPSSMLDEFMELSGEITVIRNMVNKLVRVIEKENPGNKNVQHLSELLDEMHKINSGMQVRLVETRKVSLSKVFKPLPRTVRDTARALNKTISLKMENDHIRVDTSLAQALSESMIHIVRNSLDHGIESSDRRLAAKKPMEGTVVVSAAEIGEEVVVSIEDDGGGLDIKRIKAKAVERGLYTSEELERFSNQKIFSLIFESGFSTAAQVTDVSGRGVGMDMVRSSIQKVKGRIDISSELGKGTKFSLCMPIPKSVLIISSLLVEAEGKSFAVQQDSISRLVRLEGQKVGKSIKKLEGAFVVEYEGSIIPIIDLAEILGLRPKGSRNYLIQDLQNILIIKTEFSLFALAVDKILDSEEIVVKPVGKYLERAKVYAGATFMGDGTVGLILDSMGLAELAGVQNNLAELVETKEDSDASEHKNQMALGEQQEMLLFRLWNKGSFAVPLKLIYRLEELYKNSFQVLGDRKVVIYREQTVPLIDLSEVLGLPGVDLSLKQEQDPVPVFVVKINTRNIAFLIREITDVCFAPVAIDMSVRDRDEIAGTIEVNSKVVTVLDIYAILDKTGILKMLDPGQKLSKLSYGYVDNSGSNVEISKKQKNASENSQNIESTPTKIVGDGWGVF